MLGSDVRRVGLDIKYERTRVAMRGTLQGAYSHQKYLVSDEESLLPRVLLRDLALLRKRDQDLLRVRF